MIRIFSIFKILALIFLLITLPTFSAAATINLKSDVLEKQQQAFDKAFNVSTPGPARIQLKDQGTLNLPEDYFYIPPKEASALLQAMGDETSSEFAGMVIPKDHVHWFITIDFIKSGFINDYDVTKWNDIDLLEKIKKSTRSENEERVKQGQAPLIINGWIEAPKYNSLKHQLTWSVLAKATGTQVDSNHETINYNTYALGREGYFNLSLITSDAAIADDKVHAKNILAAISYNPGKRYEDFDKHTDMKAEYGLSSLVTGLVYSPPPLVMEAILFVLDDWQWLLTGFLLILLATKIRIRLWDKAEELQ